jgi:hypothetical protein
MSLVYNDSINKDGILQRIEQELGFPDGHISGDTNRLAIWTGSVNLSLDKAFSVIFTADGKWQFDSSEHTKNPVIYTDLTINQRMYNFLADEQSNLILEIYSVYARQSTSSAYYKLNLKDQQSDGDSYFTDGITRLGWPTEYDLTGNGIKLDITPEATVTSGLQIFINREASYFATNSTSKTPGFAGLYHEYCVLEPCYRYARANNLAKQETFKRDLLELEKAMVNFYARRLKDERKIMTTRKINFR